MEAIYSTIMLYLNLFPLDGLVHPVAHVWLKYKSWKNTQILTFLFKLITNNFGIVKLITQAL